VVQNHRNNSQSPETIDIPAIVKTA